MIEAGLEYGGDPEWVYDLPAEKRVLTMAAVQARSHREGALMAQRLTPAVLIHLLSEVLGKQGKKGRPAEAGDAERDALQSLLDELG